MRNRSYAIAALVDIPAPGAHGVLFAHGARFGGHALYVRDNRLHYVYNYVGILEQKIVADQDLPTGEDLILSVASRRTARTRPARPSARSRSTTATRRSARTASRPSLGSSPHRDGLCVGRDSADPVTNDNAGTAPWAFTDGTIKRVAIDVSGEPYRRPGARSRRNDVPGVAPPCGEVCGSPGRRPAQLVATGPLAPTRRPDRGSAHRARVGGFLGKHHQPQRR
jgi:hypothetical protein